MTQFSCCKLCLKCFEGETNCIFIVKSDITRLICPPGRYLRCLVWVCLRCPLCKSALWQRGPADSWRRPGLAASLSGGLSGPAACFVVTQHLAETEVWSGIVNISSAEDWRHEPESHLPPRDGLSPSSADKLSAAFTKRNLTPAFTGWREGGREGANMQRKQPVGRGWTGVRLECSTPQADLANCHTPHYTYYMTQDYNSNERNDQHWNNRWLEIYFDTEFITTETVWWHGERRESDPGGES